MGDVKGLDADRRTLHIQQLLQREKQGAGLLLPGGRPLRLFLGVAARQHHIGTAVPADTGGQAHRMSGLLREELGHKVHAVDSSGQQDLPGNGLPLPVKLAHGGREQVLLLSGTEKTDLTARQFAVPVVEHGQTASGLPFKVTYGIQIAAAEGHHILLASAQRLHRPKTVPELGGPLKAQILRRRLHLLPEIGGDLVVSALQQQDRMVHSGPIPLRLPGGQTVAVAQAHVIVQTGTLPADLTGKAPGTGG